MEYSSSVKSLNKNDKYNQAQRETHHKNLANLQVCSSAWDAFSNRLMNESGVTQQMSNFKT